MLNPNNRAFKGTGKITNKSRADKETLQKI